MVSKHSASASMVASAPRLSVKYTKRNRLQATTAQKTNSGPISPQSNTTVSPGAQIPGRRPRWFFCRQATFASATRRRKLRADPV